jgi:hypothetical protein
MKCLNNRMRLKDILSEQTHELQARDALITILTTDHALGIGQVTVDQIIKSLEKLNFFMDKNWIRDQARQIDVVDSDQSTADTIVLQSTKSEKPGEPETTEPETNPETTDMDKDVVSKMAQQAADRRIK